MNVFFRIIVVALALPAKHQNRHIYDAIGQLRHEGRSGDPRHIESNDDECQVAGKLGRVGENQCLGHAGGANHAGISGLKRPCANLGMEWIVIHQQNRRCSIDTGQDFGNRIQRLIPTNRNRMLLTGQGGCPDTKTISRSCQTGQEISGSERNCFAQFYSGLSRRGTPFLSIP